MNTLLRLLLPLMLFSFSANAQEQFFVGKDGYLLIGKIVNFKTGEQQHSIYKDSANSTLLFPKLGYTNSKKLSKYTAFTVVRTYTIIKYTYEDVVLVLNNSELGEVYYPYNPRSKMGFGLIINGGFTRPEGYLCSSLTVEKDKFSSKITTSTPFDTHNFSITKIEDENDTTIYLNLRSYGSTLNINKTGAIILFEDGSKIELPETPIDYANAKKTSKWRYSIFIRLSNEQIEQIRTKRIVDYKLYIYEKSLSEESSNDLMEYMNCFVE